MEEKRPDTPRPMEPMDTLEVARLLLTLSRCPSCHERGTYVSHASKGLRTCNGCEDMFCTKCAYGSRYCCAYVFPPAPSTPVSRQCSVEKWLMAEEYLRDHPEETQTIADIIPERHIYIVRRTPTGEFVREHQCVKGV